MKETPLNIESNSEVEKAKPELVATDSGMLLNDRKEDGDVR
jgi:hypothetical protein